MGLLTPIAARLGAQPWMPRLLPQVVWTDKRLQRLTRGRLTLLDLAGLPNLVLTAPGRRSGILRSTPLLCVPDQGTWLVAGSYFGSPSMPAWVHNLRAAGGATVTVDAHSCEVSAEELSGEQRAAAWATMLRTWPNYAHYEARTDRLIPVFRLSRTGTEPA